MPKIDLSNVEESTGGFEMLAPGGYICEIKRVETHDPEQYWAIEWDVAEGDKAGYFKESQWPPRDFMSFKEGALGILKHKLHVLADDNNDFDGEAAINADNPTAFHGLKFGAVVRKRYYTNASGEDKEGIEIGRWCRTDEIRAGDFKEMQPRDTRTQQAQTPAPAPEPAKIELADEDIPF